MLSSLFLPLRKVAPPAQKLVDERPLLSHLKAIQYLTLKDNSVSHT
jgi:hypothetical protein